VQPCSQGAPLLSSSSCKQHRTEHINLVMPHQTDWEPVRRPWRSSLQQRTSSQDGSRCAPVEATRRQSNSAMIICVVLVTTFSYWLTALQQGGHPSNCSEREQQAAVSKGAHGTSTRDTRSDSREEQKCSAAARAPVLGRRHIC
jgi:hypothetical protein